MLFHLTKQSETGKEAVSLIVCSSGNGVQGEVTVSEGCLQLRKKAITRSIVRDKGSLRQTNDFIYSLNEGGKQNNTGDGVNTCDAVEEFLWCHLSLFGRVAHGCGSPRRDFGRRAGSVVLSGGVSGAYPHSNHAGGTQV